MGEQFQKEALLRCTSAKGLLLLCLARTLKRLMFKRMYSSKALELPIKETPHDKNQI